jgi:endonuclease G, mitochondrial
MLVSAKQLKQETNQAPIVPETQILQPEIIEEIKSGEKPVIKEITKGNILDKDENLEKRREMIEAKGFEPTEFAYERAIGENDSLYSNFTELIAITKRKVGRIIIRQNNKRLGYATGFMVSDTLMLTNWHVFKEKDLVTESEVHFFYEYDNKGRPLTPVIFKFDEAKFYFSNKDLDYCLVAVQSMDIKGEYALNNIGYLFLDKTLGKIGEVNREKLNIIHHPQGDYKQISIRENTFVGIDHTMIFYETDTAQGSSGSPVFNDQWQVVGLHHKSVAKMTADGKNFLDKDDNIIPVVNDKIDASKVVWLKNEGIRISVILKHVATEHAGNSLIAALDIAPPHENLEFIIKDQRHVVNNNANMFTNNGSNIIISVPSDVITRQQSIDINLSGTKTGIKENKLIQTTDNKHELIDELLEEVAKADKEAGVDFSKCRGYSSKFLGTDIPLPQPKKALEKQLARLKNNSFELKYFKYSVIFNAVKKMPVISAVNVEGNAAKRLDNSKRKDDWLRDKRIDIDSQLTDKFYAKSNFDKGHMSRFEDANWDLTEESAYRNGIYTCFYTNACPQVVALNRGAGIWGKLEKAILEKGVKEEQGKLARMTVFNGPIFNEEKDRIFKGHTIPMEYFKIVLWLNDDKKLKATAFKLSQEALVDHIRFDEAMHIDEEALDIDKDVKFLNYQCSIKSLDKATMLDLKYLEQYDTYKVRRGSEETLLESEEGLML